MSLLSKKQQHKRDVEEKFSAQSKRSAFTAVILLLLFAAIIAIVAQALFQALNCPDESSIVTERSAAVESYSLTASPAGGCVGPPRALFTNASGSPSSVVYLLGEGNIKSWQYVGESPINLFYHQGEVLRVHLLDSDGNFTTKMLGKVKPDSEVSVMVELPARHWHAWEPENKYPIQLFSVMTASGSPDFTQHPLVDIYEDPVLSVLANQSETKTAAMMSKFNTPPTSSYCQQTS